MRAVLLRSDSREQTRAVAAQVARALRPNDVVMLSGDLGAGKTAFVQGAAAAMGVTAHVQSPTFVIVREYQGRLPIAHVDVYRLDSLAELEDLGYEELFVSGRVVFVEWGEAVAGALPADRIEVSITRGAGDERAIEVRASAERLAEMGLS